MSSVQLLKSAIRDLESQTSLQSLGTNSGPSCVAQYETDVGSYLWSESPGDLSSDAGWVSVSQRGQQQQRSTLAMKTQALTPCIENFCSAMDAKLHIRLEDLQYYLPSQDKGKDTQSSLQSSFGGHSANLCMLTVIYPLTFFNLFGTWWNKNDKDTMNWCQTLCCTVYRLKCD